MATLVCEICGGKLVVQSGGVAKCDSCGMEYTKERIQEKIQEIKGTVKIDGAVETVNGDAEKERLLNVADECLKKGKLDEARRIYTTVSKEYSNDWRGWWGIICSTPLQEGVVLSTDSKDAYLSHEFEMAISFAPKNQQNIVTKQQQQRLKSIEKIKTNNRIKGIQNDIEIIKTQIKNSRITLEKKEKKYNAVKTRHIIGVILVIIAIVILFLTYNSRMFGTAIIVSIVIGSLGILIWNWTGNGDYERKEYERDLSTLKNLMERKESLEEALKRYQNELDR